MAVPPGSGEGESVAAGRITVGVGLKINKTGQELTPRIPPSLKKTRTTIISPAPKIPRAHPSLNQVLE